MIHLRYDQETRSGLHDDPFGAAFFLTQEGKDAVYDLVPVFRPDERGRPSIHARLFSILLGLPRLETGVPFSSAMISRILRKDHAALRDHHLRLRSWVEEINASSDGLIDIHFIPADYEEGYARTIDRIGIDLELQQSLFHELLDVGMVDLATDRVLSRYALERARVERVRAAQQLAELRAEGEQRAFVDFLNGQHVRAFALDQECVKAARAWAAERYNATRCSGALAERRKHQWAHARRTLCRTQLYPKPLYQTSALTSRLNPFGAGLLGLPTPMRHLLQPGNYILDLESAHLRIFAALHDIPQVSAVLADRTLYAQLANVMGEEWTAESAKEVLKHNAVLPMIYGSEEQQIRYRLRGENLSEAVIDAALNHPICKEIGSACEEVMEKILHEGGLQGHDKFYDLETVLRQKTKQREDGSWVRGEQARKKAARSVLALTNQSYEWAIMKPVRDAALAGKCLIPAWQHDGCDIRPKGGISEEQLMRRLSSEISDRGEQLLGVEMPTKVKRPA